MNFPKRLKYARRCAGLSQSQAAKLLGVSKDTFKEYEGGSVPSEVVKVLAELYDVSYDYLMHNIKNTKYIAKGMNKKLKRLLQMLP